MNHMRPFLSLCIAAVFWLAATPGIAGPDGRISAGPAARKLNIVATVFPLAEFAASIVGERGDVVLLLPPGADVHNWLPKVSDIRKIETADLLVSIGHGLEPWLASLIGGVSARKIPNLEAAEGLRLLPAGLEEGHDHDQAEEAGEGHAHEGADPHVWLDFAQDEEIVEALTRALTKISPVDATRFLENAAALKKRLRDLDDSFRLALEPFKGRKFFVGGHAAFAYLAERYGLVQVAVSGLSPDAGPTPRDTAAAISRARAEGVTTVYYELSSGEKMARLIAAEIRADVRALYPGHNLTAAQAAERATFFHLMERNLENLIHGFTGR